jgi:NitT/TauT family transport system permease protein
VAAAASVIGAIIGELPSGIPEGLGSAILNYNQYYVTAPERLWATIVACSLVGLCFVGLVRVAEWLVTRGRYRTLEIA